MTNFITRPGENYMQLKWLEPLLRVTGGYVAGGAFKNIFLGQKVKDIDIFFETHSEWKKSVTNCRQLGFDVVYENDKVVAFRDDKTGVMFELVGVDDPSSSVGYSNGPYFGMPRDVLRNFDFTVTQFAMVLDAEDDEDSVGFHVLFHPDFFEHLHMKRLVIDPDSGLPYPISTFERVLRYTKYGFGLCKESKALLIMGIKESEETTLDGINASLYNGMD